MTWGRPTRYLEGHPDGDVQLSNKSAEFIKPFLEQCGLFDEVHCLEACKFDSFRLQIENLICLDDFRMKKINFFSGDSRNWYYSLSNIHFNKDFSERLFQFKFTGDERAKDYVLVTNTNRVNNTYIPISTCLVDHKDDVAFIGLDDEYKRVCFLIDKELPRFELKDLADAARLMMGSRGVIGNQGGLYSLAEMLKVPRILIPPEYIKVGNTMIGGPCNVHPQGGWHDEVLTIENARKLTNALFERKP